MRKRTVFPWFRTFTLPVFIGGVSMTIAAAAVGSSTLMFSAAAVSGVGLASLLVGRYLINDPDPPKAVRIEPAAPKAPEREHAVAHH
jgi:hypothetical protein